MTKKTNSRRRSRSIPARERDGQYLLKLVIVIISGTLWLKFQHPFMVGGIPIAGIPLGAIIGILAVHYFEKINEDRKIWFAILLLVTLISFFLPAGIMI